MNYSLLNQLKVVELQISVFKGDQYFIELGF